MSGEFRDVYRTELTPVSFLTRSAYVFPQKTAVVHGSRRYSYAQLGERVHRLASALRGAGMKKHDRVAFLCPNIPAMLEAHFGVPAAGGILVAVNTRLGSDEIGYILKHSGSRFLFVDHELEGLVKPADLTGVRVVRVDDTGAVGDPYEEFLATGSPDPVESWLDDEDETISINYTSGTTGRPKGVMYSHRGAWLNAVGEVIEAHMSFDTKYLWALPMFHCNGWCFPWGVTAVAGTHVCLRKVESARIWELIDKDGAARQGLGYALFDLVRVVDADMHDVPKDGVTLGEVIMRGNNVMTGYFEQRDATAEAFRGGWFHSGDLAVWHPDGYIELRDRKKDIIISGGENISTIEVEQTVAKHPAVLECAVVAIPDERWGERPKAFVALKPGTKATEQEVIEFCRRHIAHFKCPAAVEFGDLPKTSTGKVQKFVLREKEWRGKEKRIN